MKSSGDRVRGWEKAKQATCFFYTGEPRRVNNEHGTGMARGEPGDHEGFCGLCFGAVGCALKGSGEKRLFPHSKGMLS